MARRERAHGATAVVLGLGQNGMATVRALGRAGVPVIGIDGDLTQPGARTRYASPVHCADFEAAGPALLESLVRIGRGLEASRAVLFPSGDMNLALVSAQRDALAPYYHVALPSHDVVSLFLDKKAFYQFAMAGGFPIPRTFFPADAGALDEAAERIAYPCLIKPFQPNAAWRAAFDTRLFIARSPEVLRQLYARLAPVHRDLIVQEYMPGADSELYWSATYLDRGGRPLALWTGRKLRQYPRRFGSTSLAESRWVPEIADATVEVLRAAGHRGLAFAEFKRDGRDGRFKLTEVTAGRTWFPHGLVTASGVNLPLIMYRDALGLDVAAPTPYVQGMKWIHEERDLKTVLRYYLPQRELGLGSWLASYRGRRVYALAAWDDPRPFVASVGRVLAAAGQEVWRRIAGSRSGAPPAARDPLLVAADPVSGPRHANRPERTSTP